MCDWFNLNMKRVGLVTQETAQNKINLMGLLK
nr:MAG TPA: hypothetical protein [Bacteriophage sp.]